MSSRLVKIIERKYVRNGVLSLKYLKRSNYHLFKLITNNLDYYKQRFFDESGIEILEDTYSIKTLERIRLYLKHYYGDTVNLSKVRVAHQQLYLNICQFGKPYDVLTGLGFKVVYNRKWKDKEDIL